MEPSAVAGGEVRRVHVVYFLCRSGVVEQPHLIRVHHLHRHGVHLRDVKRWLSELRGKDMPESFSWSYKRRYKAGYVWQDLTEDDLITPISDNEYVLKGSELADNHNNPLFDTFTPGRITPERACLHFEPKLDAGLDFISPPETLHIDRDDNISPKPPPRLDNDSPGGNSTPPPSTTTLHQLPMSPLPTLRDHFGLENAGKPPPPPATPPPPPPPVKQIAVLEIDTWRKHEKVELEKKQRQEQDGGGGGRGSADGGKGGGRHSFYIGSGRRASHGLYDLLRCRVVETDDSVRFTGDRRDGDCLAGGRTGFSHKTFDGSSAQPSIHSPRSRRKSQSTNGEKSPRMVGERPISAVYKPVGEPNCSHCGKAFNPEKFHSHMKSCSVLRRLRKD